MLRVTAPPSDCSVFLQILFGSLAFEGGVPGQSVGGWKQVWGSGSYTLSALEKVNR